MDLVILENVSLSFSLVNVSWSVSLKRKRRSIPFDKNKFNTAYSIPWVYLSCNCHFSSSCYHCEKLVQVRSLKMLNYEGSCSRMYAKHIINKPVNLLERRKQALNPKFFCTFWKHLQWFFILSRSPYHCPSDLKLTMQQECHHSR